MSKHKQNAKVNANARAKRSKRRPKKRGAWKAWLLALVVLALMSYLTRLIVIEPIRISTGALNGYSRGDVVLANKLELLTDWEIARGDVVLSTFGSAEGRYVRRVAGLPGDVIETVDGVAYLVYKDADGANARVDLGAPKALAYGRIPENAYLLLSDNPDGNPDGRVLGLVTVSNIKAKMGRVVWPLSRFFRGE